MTVVSSVEIRSLGWEGIPQGLKPLYGAPCERPEAKASGYLEAKARATATADPLRG